MLMLFQINAALLFLTHPAFQTTPISTTRRKISRAAEIRHFGNAALARRQQNGTHSRRGKCAKSGAHESGTWYNNLPIAAFSWKINYWKIKLSNSLIRTFLVN